jgi:hypothetical protein
MARPQPFIKVEPSNGRRPLHLIHAIGEGRRLRVGNLGPMISKGHLEEFFIDYTMYVAPRGQ